MFVSQRIFNTEIPIPVVGPVNSDLCFFGLARRGDGMILSTVPGMVTLGCSGIRAVSRFNSAILADLAMRGFAISLLTPVLVEASDSFLAFLCSMDPS